jgi:acetate kinase
VLLYILRTSGSNVEELEKLLDKESGLLGISGISGDMRQLHQMRDDPAARCAVEIFCRKAKKAIGAFIAILGGLDLLVFTAGIGEHDPIVREKICAGFESLGIVLDSHKNESNSETISSDASRALVRVLPSEEEIQIARNTFRLL